MSNITYKNNCLALSGPLDFDTVMDLWRSSLPLLAERSELTFDLSSVSNSNSAGLALLLEWVKYAKNSNKRIHFKNIPSQLLSIAAVSGIDKIIIN